MIKTGARKQSEVKSTRNRKSETGIAMKLRNILKTSEGIWNIPTFKEI